LDVHGLDVPPFTVGSLAMSTHSTPSMTPIPVTMLPPIWNWVPHAASGDSSRNGASRSTSSSMRSRANSLPRLWWRETYFSPPPATAFACSASSSVIFSSIASR